MSAWKFQFWIFDVQVKQPRWTKLITIDSLSRQPTVKNTPCLSDKSAGGQCSEHYRQISYAYNVVEEKCDPPKLEHDPFYFLDSRKAGTPTVNTILIDPVSVGLPWYSTMKGSPQCIYWREAEKAGMQVIKETLEARGAGAVIPEKLRTSDKRRKMFELVETAVTICIYLYACSDAPRIRILTKAIVFLFLHDDVIESSINQEGGSILEGWDTDSFTAEELDGSSRNDIFLKFCREAITLDPILGLELMQDTVRWARFSRENSANPNKSHQSWKDFVAFRELDIAYDFMVTAVRFGAAVLYSPEDRPVFHWIEKLYIQHCLYVNDLYSYEKECREYEKEGAPLHNSVHAIEQTLSVPSSSAKVILLSILWDCERQVRDEYERLMKLPELKQEQIFYLQRLIESFAGNYMYSSTTYRYARLSGRLLQPPSKECLLRDYL